VQRSGGDLMIWIGVSVLGGNLSGRIDDFRFGIGSHGNGQSTSLWPFVWGMQNYWQLDMAKAPPSHPNLKPHYEMSPRFCGFNSCR